MEQSDAPRAVPQEDAAVDPDPERRQEAALVVVAADRAYLPDAAGEQSELQDARLAERPAVIKDLLDVQAARFRLRLFACLEFQDFAQRSLCAFNPRRKDRLLSGQWRQEDIRVRQGLKKTIIMRKRAVRLAH